MIEKSKELAAQINAQRPKDNELAVWWIGQSGFVLKTSKYCLITDPYLSTTLEDATREMGPAMRHVRMTPIPVDPEDITCADYLLCSHDHGDHYDAASVRGILKGSPQCQVVVPPAAKASLVRDGIDEGRIRTVGTEDALEAPDLSITAVRAKHNQFDYTEEFGYPYVGYIIRTGGLCVYHAGDTILFDELPALLREQRIDVGLIPINGYDEQRIKTGFQSNFRFDEAAELAKDVGIKMMIPCHYDMFTANTEQIGRFVNYMNQSAGMPPYRVPVIGEAIMIEKEKLL